MGSVCENAEPRRRKRLQKIAHLMQLVRLVKSLFARALLIILSQYFETKKSSQKLLCWNMKLDNLK